MKHEIIILMAFEHLTGKQWGISSDDKTIELRSTLNGEAVNLYYEDTGNTKVVHNKPRRIFELKKIKRADNGHR